jgi:hypothetical protein
MNQKTIQHDLQLTRYKAGMEVKYLTGEAIPVKIEYTDRRFKCMGQHQRPSDYQSVQGRAKCYDSAHGIVFGNQTVGI